MKALVRNAGDEQQVANAKESVTHRAEREAAEWVTLMSHPGNRARLWDILGRCHTYETIFSTESLIMARDAGQQEIGHWLLAKIGTASPALLLIMQQEAARREGNEIEPPVRLEEDADG